MAVTYVYRITLERTLTFNVGYKQLRTFHQKRVIPAATRQRLGCIVAYQRQAPPDERWDITAIERAEVGEFQTAELAEVIPWLS